MTGMATLCHYMATVLLFCSFGDTSPLHCPGWSQASILPCQTPELWGLQVQEATVGSFPTFLRRWDGTLSLEQRLSATEPHANVTFNQVAGVFSRVYLY